MMAYVNVATSNLCFNRAHVSSLVSTNNDELYVADVCDVHTSATVMITLILTETH